MLAATLFLAAQTLTFSQTVPSAYGPSARPLDVGVGVSENFLDWSPGSKMLGVSAFADWHCFQSRGLSRVGIEGEGRDVNYMHPSGLSKMRFDTAQGGINFTLASGEKGRFYAKGLAGVGSIDFPGTTFPSGITHKTQQMFSLGEGLDIRLGEFLNLNLDIESQIWLHFFPKGSALTPSALTVGVSHTFGRSRREKPSFVQ